MRLVCRFAYFAIWKRASRFLAKLSFPSWSAQHVDPRKSLQVILAFAGNIVQQRT